MVPSSGCALPFILTLTERIQLKKTLLLSALAIFTSIQPQITTAGFPVINQIAATNVEVLSVECDYVPGEDQFDGADSPVERLPDTFLTSVSMVGDFVDEISNGQYSRVEINHRRGTLSRRIGFSSPQALAAALDDCTGIRNKYVNKGPNFAAYVNGAGDFKELHLLRK